MAHFPVGIYNSPEILLDQMDQRACYMIYIHVSRREDAPEIMDTLREKMFERDKYVQRTWDSQDDIYKKYWSGLNRLTSPVSPFHQCCISSRLIDPERNPELMGKFGLQELSSQEMIQYINLINTTFTEGEEEVIKFAQFFPLARNIFSYYDTLPDNSIPEAKIEELSPEDIIGGNVSPVDFLQPKNNSNENETDGEFDGEGDLV